MIITLIGLVIMLTGLLSKNHIIVRFDVFTIPFSKPSNVFQKQVEYGILGVLLSPLLGICYLAFHSLSQKNYRYVLLCSGIILFNLIAIIIYLLLH
jgi:hypothetical protein